MNGTNPTCDKTPIRAAIEDAVVVFVYSFLTAIVAVIGTGTTDYFVFVVPVAMAGMQSLVTYARVRNIDLPTEKKEGT